MTTQATPSEAPAPSSSWELDEGARPKLGFRWVVCGLLFLSTTINYIDRFTLGVLAPELQKTLGWSDSQYGDINASFSLAYAIGFLAFGAFIDRVGTKFGYAVALAAWSIAAAAHGLARSATGFAAARFLLGLGESGNFPAAIKATAEWFPRRERALATGLFNAGSNVGAVIAPLVVPWLALTWGWEAAFLATGLAGLIWLAFWLPLYGKPEGSPWVSKKELAWIRSDPQQPGAAIPWRRLLPHRETWAVAAGKFLTDPAWWFYLFWSGKFLADRFGVDLKRIGPPLVAIYLMADVGSIAGGWLSSHLIGRGWSANAARKLTLAICALFAAPVSLAPLAPDMWTAVFLIGLAAAAHQGFSANMYTLASDLFPPRAVGSVIGIAGTAGAVGGILMQSASGRVRDWTGSYLPMFVVAGSMYALAVLSVHLLSPRLTPAPVDNGEEAA